MQTSVLEPWLPRAETTGEWNLDEIVEGSSGLKVSLERDARTETLVVEFGWVVAYRRSPNHLYAYSPEGGSLRRARDSEYLSWIKKVASGVYDQPFFHFAFLTVDGTIDVLATCEPNVRVQKSSV